MEEFLASDYTFHTMRDHPQHGIAVLAGMWGAKVNETRERMSETFEVMAKVRSNMDNKSRSTIKYDAHPLLEND